jgi:hypothetical protein
VTISKDEPALFGEIFGLANMDIGARAVARVQDGTTTSYAIFTNRQSCSDGDGDGGDDNGSSSSNNRWLEIDGDNIRVTGAIHSNNKIRIHEADDGVYTGPITYVCSNSGFRDQGRNNSYPQPQRISRQNPPIDLTFGSFTCTLPVFSGNLNLNSNNGQVRALWVNNTQNSRQLRPNVICATGNISLSNNLDNVTGQVTLVAGGEIEIDGDDANLVPYPGNNVQFFSSSSDPNAIDLNGDGGRYAGYIHAPHGRVDIHGDGVRIAGSIVSDRVHLEGRDMRIDVTGFNQTPGRTIWLVE